MTTITTPTMSTSLRTWFHENYPYDPIWTDMDEAATFEDLFDALDHYRNVYETIGVGDSIVRECLFSGLAACIGTDYGYIYNQWLR